MTSRKGKATQLKGIRRRDFTVPPKDETLRYYTYDEAPPIMQDNPFILTGYRCGYTFKMCCRSLFALHNETMNVWTHLVGVAFFLLLALQLFANVLEPRILHYAVFAIYCLGCVMCFACSTAFHLFYCHHNPRLAKWLHSMDYFGATCLISASFVPFIYYAFACSPGLRTLYLVCITLFGSAGLTGPFFDFWTTLEFHLKKMGIYIMMASSGLIPGIHMLVILPSQIAFPFAKGGLLMLTMYGVGVIFYMFKIPERWFPGQFDVWGHSHQMWHIFVFAATCVHFFNCTSMYIQWENMEFHC
jgi:channel protein (hemolysin III family)